MLRFFVAATTCICISFFTINLADAGSKAVVPFDGKSLKGWKLKKSNNKSYWTAGNVRMSADNPRGLTVLPATSATAGALINAKGRGVDSPGSGYSQA